MADQYFVTGIGTGIGKTIVSAILTEHLEADYWKPVQAGDLDQSDSLKVKSLISNSHTTIHPECYQLTQPMSPHASAKLDHIEIQISNFKLPETKRPLIVEGAGGLMVPLNENDLIMDLISFLKLEVILISQNYLGSINHTLLTVNTLKQQGIKIKGIIFNGEANAESERYILTYTKLPCLGKIPPLETPDKETIREAGKYLSFLTT
jgi:dethiobiotin synthetase